MADAWFPRRSELDVADRDSVRRAVDAYRPDRVLHCAAFTDVVAAQTRRADCWRTNVDGTRHLVEALESMARPFRLLLVSSACVFSGEDPSPCTEDDLPAPKNFYGLTKLLSEFVVQRCRDHLVVRTNFVPESAWPHARAFTDRFGTYLYSADVAAALVELLAGPLQGLVHVVGDRRMSLMELALRMTPGVPPMTLQDMPDVPLTRDMSLASVRWPARQLGWVAAKHNGSTPGWG